MRRMLFFPTVGLQGIAEQVPRDVSGKTETGTKFSRAELGTCLMFWNAY